jgi:outer membrane autotransporter protein
VSKYHLFKQGYALGALTTLLLFCCSNAFADNWLGTSSTDWFTTSNWSAGIPDSSTDVTVNSLGASPTISSAGAQARTLILGQTTPSTLIISAGASLHTVNSYIAFGSTISGTATVAGSNAVWNNDNFMAVGYSGAATLFLNSGGIINTGSASIGSQSLSTGTLLLDGAGSQFNIADALYVGESGSGSLIVTDGGVVNSGTTYVGLDAGSTGFMEVDGAGSAWNNSGDVIVSNDNASSGQLQISDGGVVSDANGIIGNAAGSSGEVTVSDAGTVWNNSNSLVIGNAGVGTLTLSNTAVINVSGVSTVNIGANSVLNIGAATTDTAAVAGTLSAASVQLNNNAMVVFNHTSNNYAFASSIAGSGSILQMGAGTTILSGTNSYTGGTVVSAGTLQGTSASLQGGIVNNSHVIFDQANTGNFSGAISGTGDLTKNGAGTVVFNNANSYAGNTTINSGTLQIAAENNLGNGSIINLNSGTLAVSNSLKMIRNIVLTNSGGVSTVGDNTVLTLNHISGNGSLIKTGMGTLLLGSPVSYTGNTLIQQGTLQAGAADVLAASPQVQIASGAQFDLAGSSQRVNNLVNNGVVSITNPNMGNTFHTLTVTNNLSGNGTLDMATNLVNETADFVNVLGTTSGTQQITILNAVQNVDPPAQTVIKLVQTTGGTGIFTGASDAGTFRFEVLSGNGSAVTPDPNAWYLEFSSDLTNTANAAIGLYSSSLYLLYSDMQTLTQRMGELRLNHGSGVWVKPYYNGMTINNQASRTFNQNTGGFDVGVDRGINSVYGGHLNVGVFSGYLYAAQNFHQNTSGSAQGFSLGAYATWFHAKGWYVDAIVKYFQLWNDFKASTDSTVATANYSVPSVGGSLEAGKRFDIKILQKNFFVEPQVQIKSADVQGMNYAASNGLLVDGDSQTSGQGRIGSRAGMHFEFKHKKVFEPYVQASLIEEFSANNSITTNTTYFTTKIPPTVGQFGAGATMQLSFSAYAYGEYDYAFGRGFHEPAALSAGVRWAW